MIMYKKILFPVDIYENAAKLIPHVKTITQAFNSEIHLLYVAKPNEYYVEDEPEAGKSIKEKVNNFKELYCKDLLSIKVAVLDGEIALEILSYIEKEDIDMVIMATKGKSALGKAVFGSTAAQVVRGAGVPVLLINPPNN